MCFGNGLPRQSADWLAMTGFFLLLLYFLISLNTSAMSMSYMCFSMRVTMLL